MPDLVAVAGGRFFIGGPLEAGITDFTEASFASQTWVEADGWETRGDVGDSAELITTSLINRGRDFKQKGTFNAGSMENSFSFLIFDPGQAALIAASKIRQQYAFRALYSDTPIVKTSVVTVTIASPGVFTYNAHGMTNGTRIRLTTTGALPTGLAVATDYFVVGQTTNNFSLALTVGGAAIVTTGTQSGVHTLTSFPVPTVDFFTGQVMGAPIGGGGANDIQMLNVTIEICSNVVTVAARG
jgi:hypothetical protein